jgi:hypothetical protein
MIARLKIILLLIAALMSLGYAIGLLASGFACDDHAPSAITLGGMPLGGCPEKGR